MSVGPRQRHGSGPDPVLRLDRATIGYRGRPVVLDADLTVAAGEALALLGRNGSGKTTLVRGLVGLAEVLAGEVELLGTPLSAGHRGSRTRVGYVPQRHRPGGAVTSTAREVVGVGLLARRRPWRRPRREDRATVYAALAEVGLDELARVPVTELSGGQQRRLLIARALVAEPDLLLLDEPTAGVDRAGVDALVATLAAVKSRGRALVVVSHDVSELGGVPDRAVTLSHGRLVRDEVLAGGSRPDTDTIRSGAGTTRPDTVRSDAGTVRSDAGTTRPGAGTGTARPDTNTARPDTNTARPDTNRARPIALSPASED